MKTLEQIQNQLNNISEEHFDLVNTILTENGWKAFDTVYDPYYGNVEYEKAANEAKYNLFFAKHIFYK